MDRQAFSIHSAVVSVTGKPCRLNSGNTHHPRHAARAAQRETQQLLPAIDAAVDDRHRLVARRGAVDRVIDGLHRDGLPQLRPHATHPCLLLPSRLLRFAPRPRRRRGLRRYRRRGRGARGHPTVRLGRRDEPARCLSFSHAADGPPRQAAGVGVGVGVGVGPERGGLQARGKVGKPLRPARCGAGRRAARGSITGRTGHRLFTSLR